MHDLIRINSNSERHTVSGRELHEFLEVGTEYSKWMTRMSEYGFAENVDFQVIVKSDENSTGGRPSTDHQLTIDMAKEISMIQRTDKGKQARQYFLEVERQLKNPRPMSQLEIMHQMTGALIEQDRILKQHQQQLESVTEQLQEIRDNAVYVPDNWRKDINGMVKRAAFKVGGTAYSDIRTESYALLESRAHCDLKRLVTNLKTRKQQSGARKTEVDAVCNMDVIESDPRLREVYTGICKELTLKYGG